MAFLIDRLSARVGAAFAGQGLPEDLGRVVVSDRPDLSHFQCNGAMAAAKLAKKAPRDIATKIVEALQGDAQFAEVSIAGPGFINFRLSDDVLNAVGGEIAADEKSAAGGNGTPLTIVLDFGGPNIAKPMHVGHLRSSIIGDCLQRLSRFLGHTTVSDIHMGDWGKPIGMLIAELKREQPDLPYFDESFKGEYPQQPPVTMEDLERLYPQAAANCKADATRDEEARVATTELQDGRRGYRALWRQFFDVSKVGMEREFDALGVKFDLWKGESDVDALVPDMVAQLTGGGFVEASEGAEIIRVAGQGDTSELPPLILVNRDGGQTYATTDLATILDRVRTYHPDHILYVVDQRQHTHFEQVFRAAHKTGVANDAALEHIGFGTMNGPDGKPFKTRAGGLMKLHDLITMMREKAQERLDEAGLAKDAPDREKQAIASQIGIAALKFADLGNHRLSNYIFDIDRFVQFEGKTGPYLQYAAVRIQSILAKAAERGIKAGEAPITVQSDLERALVLRLAQFADAVAAAFDKRAPNIVCDHVYALAQDFSRFYTEHHILSEQDEALRSSRLTLARTTLHQLTLGLDLLGIGVPERM